MSWLLAVLTILLCIAAGSNNDDDFLGPDGAPSFMDPWP